MKRAANAAPRFRGTVEHYANPAMVAAWQKAFSKGRQPKEKRKTRTKAVMKEQVENSEPAVRLIQRQPVTFQIRRGESDFEKVAFVCSIVRKDDQHVFKSVVHVAQTRSGSRLVATDGRRLHVAFIPHKIKSGNYVPHVLKDSVSFGEPESDIQFPNWERVVPSATRKKGVIDLTGAKFGKDNDETEKLSVAYTDLVKHTGIPVNLRFLADLTGKLWSIHCQKETPERPKFKQPILLREEDSKDTYAVVMPIARDDDMAKAA